MAKKNKLPLGGLTSDGTSVTINEVELGYLVQLAGWANFVQAADKTLQIHALSLPVDYRLTRHHEGSCLWRVAPDRVLVRSDAKLEFPSNDEIVSLDLSDARVMLSVEGPGAAGLLSRVVALDFSEQGFPIGRFAQSSLHHVGVLIDRTGRDAFTVLIPTTWARSLTDLLLTHMIAAA
ncbi:sarcosine oxidase subunit gamma [Agrobacterium cavarae]|uniref:sarcosine oxidase subunit gamma n=1 Tax=Agrobacterium cavarae TaxID=2528239 RepID=UPI003FCFC5C0